MAVQRVDRPCVVLPIDDPSRLIVSDGSGVNSQRTISVSLYPPSCRTTSNPCRLLAT